MLRKNIYLRSCHYAGQKHTWKEVIKEQLKRYLIDLRIEAGIVTSETRYFEVSPEEHCPKEKYGLKILEIIAKIGRE